MPRESGRDPRRLLGGVLRLPRLLLFRPLCDLGDHGLCIAGPCRKDDVLIVAGDVSDRLDTFSDTMRTLTSVYGCVCFVAGNHDLYKALFNGHV